MAPPQIFLDAVLDSEDAAELTELEATEALWDTELEMEDCIELAEADALEAPSDTWLLPADNEELAASEKLDADFEISEPTDFRLLDACSAAPGSDPTIEYEGFAERLLALSLATDEILSTVP